LSHKYDKLSVASPILETNKILIDLIDQFVNGVVQQHQQLLTTAPT
jgi:hypothetical protein